MKHTILIVDDFDNTRKIIKQSLSDKEYDLFEASNGVEALRYFDGRTIDILITDLNMPVMDGIELVKHVRNQKTYEFIPIILLTTERNSVKLKQAQEVKVTTIVSKPFEVSNFQKIVGKCLKHSMI